MKKDKMGRIMTPEEQIDRWVAGDPVHNGENSGNGECCPDFSCCKPHLLAEEAVRRRYKEAGSQERTQMLMEFLGAMIADHGKEKEVYIAGQVEAYDLDDPDRKVH
jgi:hypothetical protein